MTVRVLVVEPLQLVGEALASLLRTFAEIDCLGWADGPDLAGRVLGGRPFDVLVLTVAAPPADGPGAVRRWRGRIGAAAILAVTDRHESLPAERLIEAGAAGVAARTDTPGQWVAAIEAVAGGGQAARPAPAGDPMAGGRGEPDLTARQRQILQAVAEGKTSRQIAAAMGITVKTVEAHRHHICRRLRVRSIAGLTKYALREGLTDLGG